jgi:hypothetical protein
MIPFVESDIDGSGEHLIYPATIYHDDGTTEKIYILHKNQIDNDKSTRRHFRITQIYMIVSIAAIIITSAIALIQIKKQ